MHKLKMEQQPRKRSNSLPITKMEISVTDDSEPKRKYHREYETFSNQNGVYNFELLQECNLLSFLIILVLCNE